MNKTMKQKIITYNKIKHASVTIGVLLPPYISDTKTNIKAYLDPTYVKWLSKAKAAVVPIMYNLDKKTLYNYLAQINGILLPGGGIDNKKTHSRKQFLTYQNTFEAILRYVKTQNDKQNYYPIWATCMSFQLLPIIEVKGKQKTRNNKLLDDIYYEGVDNLYMTSNLQKSRLSHLFTKKQINLLKKKKSTFHIHKKSYYLNNNLLKKFKKHINIIAVNKDNRNREYLSIYEYKKYPFYGVIFHPEYPLINKKRLTLKIAKKLKNKELMLLSDKLGEFFIDECKKNKNIAISLTDKTINKYPIYEYNNKDILNRMYYFKN